MTEYTHDRVQDLLFQYLDDQVSPRQRAGIEQHLAACGDCSRELETSRAANDAFTRVVRRPLSEDFYARFEVALERQVREPRAGKSLGAGGSQSTASPSPEPEAPSPPALSPFPPRRTVSPWRFAVGVAAAFVLALGVILFLKGRQGSLMLAGRLNEVTITRSGTNLPTGRAIALETYDRVTTGDNSYAVFTMGGTGSVRVGPATQFIATSGRSLRVVHGQVWVQEGVDARLVVETRFATARPVGTVFNVEASDEATTVTVHDGTVEIGTPSGQARPVHAGSRAVATATGVLVDNVGPEYLEHPWVKWNQGLVVTPPVPGLILSGATLEPPRTPEPTAAPAEPAPLPEASGFPQGGASPFPPVGIPTMAPTAAPRATRSPVRPSPAGGTPGPVSSPWPPGPSPLSPGRDAAGGRGPDSSPGQGNGRGTVDHEGRSQGEGPGGRGSSSGNPGGSGAGSGDSPASGGADGSGSGKGPGQSEGGVQGPPIYGPAPGFTPPSRDGQAPGGAAPVSPPVAPGGSAPSQPGPAAPAAPSNPGSAPGGSAPVAPSNPGSAPGGTAPVAPSNPGSAPGGSAPMAPGSNPGGGTAPQGRGSGGRH